MTTHLARAALAAFALTLAVPAMAQPATPAAAAAEKKADLSQFTANGVADKKQDSADYQAKLKTYNSARSARWTKKQQAARAAAAKRHGAYVDRQHDSHETPAERAADAPHN